MTITGVIPADLAKEIRALLPLWLACLATVWIGGLGDPFLFRAGFLAYLLGSAALGALSIGHEYTNRTLSLLLSFPVSRRLFVTKACVLLPMLAILAVVAVVRLPVAPAGRELRDTLLVGALSMLGSVFLAPWLTIVSRNVIAGALFSLSLPAALLVGSELVTIAVYGVAGLDAPMGHRFRMEFLWASMLILSAIGAVSSWRGFIRLETIEGSPREFRWLALRARAGSTVAALETPRRIHPVRTLVRKELSLQQLTFVISALYSCAWIAALMVGRLTSVRDVDDGLMLLTMVHGAIVALLAGSLASAEERHLGVLQSQVLMPMSMLWQWTIKAGVVIGLCVMLAMGLPAALTLASYGASYVHLNVPFAMVVILLAGVALYVSSVCNTSVKALVASGPAALTIFVLIRLLGDFVPWLGRLVGVVPVGDPLGPWILALIGAIVFLFLVGFGFRNHQSSDTSSLRIWRQVLWLSGSVSAVMLIAVIVR